MCGVAVQITLFQRGHNASLEPIPHLGEVGRLSGHFLLADLTGLTEADDQGNRQRTRTHSALMSATINLSGDPHPRVLFPDIEGAAPFRTVDLVSGEGHEIDAHGLDVDGNFSHTLCGIAMKEHA